MDLAKEEKRELRPEVQDSAIELLEEITIVRARTLLTDALTLDLQQEIATAPFHLRPELHTYQNSKYSTVRTTSGVKHQLDNLQIRMQQVGVVQQSRHTLKGALQIHSLKLIDIGVADLIVMRPIKPRSTTGTTMTVKSVQPLNASRASSTR